MEQKNKRRILGAFAAYYTAFTINYVTQFLNAVDGFTKLGNYAPLSKENIDLIHYQEKCRDELRSPWLFIPGSFLWRKVEEPILASPKTIKTTKPFPVIKA